jgi:hypothetical protein
MMRDSDLAPISIEIFAHSAPGFEAQGSGSTISRRSTSQRGLQERRAFLRAAGVRGSWACSRPTRG